MTKVFRGRSGDPTGKTFPPEPLTKDEMAALLGTCSRRASSGIRDLALIVVLWRGQLRVGEALKLKVSDVDLEKCQIRVLHGKRNKDRVAVIDARSALILGKWMNVRESLGITGFKPMFCQIKQASLGKAMNTTQVRTMLHYRARKAGIHKRVHPHGLRHTGASELAEEGVSLLDIQEQLGHKSPATTSKYLHQINPTARSERLKKREW
jgi:site-specific recombinase XerD